MGKYISLMRLDHWLKNIFILPGFFVALAIDGTTSHSKFMILFLAFFGTCIASSANYTINEYLDRHSDKYHPVKKQRASVQHVLDPRIVLMQYLTLIFTAFLLIHNLGPVIFWSITIFLILGILYNVSPIRLKDLAYADVVTESLNNPVRLIIGWAAGTAIIFPPISLMICYWMSGAFLMAAKRYAEYRSVSDKATLHNYRKSFAHYTETTLFLSCVFYAQAASFMFGAFAMKYRAELLLFFPFLAILFCWYFFICTQRENRERVTVEEIHNFPVFVTYFVICLIFLSILSAVDIPAVHFLIDHNVSLDARLK